MKYEAKNVGGVATSQAAGTPWVNISQTNAISAADATGGHLITEAEWMTIAADVLSVKHNWSGGAVGSGYIFRGHANGNPSSTLAASDDDSDGLFGITGGTGSASGTNSQRTLVLTSGDVIWDFSGNVWEWTNATISGAQPGTSGYAWRQYTAISSWGVLPSTSRPSALAGSSGLSSIATWNSGHGVGQIYSNSDETGVRAFLRGGDYNGTVFTGVLTLFLSYTPTNFNTYIGFRAAR
ncbi:MAG: hypothetical protein V9G04_10035 [Nocardioides sp.]|jgi:hypothetical protein